MKRNGIIVLGMFIMLTGCYGQTKKGNEESESELIKPKTNIHVNKEYDEQGNLIRYDSSYSYYYSNIDNDTMLEDSIMGDFRNHFNNRYGFLNEPFFEDYFFEDSLLEYDFYKKDFFSNRHQWNMQYMDQLFREMDSLKNQFFLRQFPPDEEGAE